MKVENTVFLSYRRENMAWALAVYQSLSHHGYDVFIDFEGIASGDFGKTIVENIRARAHFIVILTPLSLGRCADPKDWFRREIETAIASHRNIVPVLLDGFSFTAPGIAKQLVGSLSSLQEYSGLVVPAGYFTEAMDRLRTKFLNIALDAVLHPASSEAKQVAVKQKAAAELSLTEDDARTEPDSPTARASFEHRAPGVYAILTTTKGIIACKLFPQDAPQTVANFIGLAEGTKPWSSPSKKGDKLYDGTIFHRVIPDFMIQGGDPEGTGMGGPGYRFADETKGSPHNFKIPGKLAMANAGPNTNGSQFFITVTDTSWLTGKHTIFGEVTAGYDVVQKISKVPRDAHDEPKTPVVLQSVTIERR